MITVIEQSTSERLEETRQLFNSIQPLLDKGYSYIEALQNVGRITPNTHYFNIHQGWGRDLLEYGESQGYRYCDYKKR